MRRLGSKMGVGLSNSSLPKTVFFISFSFSFTMFLGSILELSSSITRLMALLVMLEFLL